MYVCRKSMRCRFNRLFCDLVSCGLFRCIIVNGCTVVSSRCIDCLLKNIQICSVKFASLTFCEAAAVQFRKCQASMFLVDEKFDCVT